MPEEAVSRSPRPGRALFGAAAFVIVVAGLRAASGILQPLLLAGFLAVLSYPLLDWLRRKGVRTYLAVVITVLADLGVLTGLGFLISGAVNEFASTAPDYINALVAKGRTAIQALEERGVAVSEWFSADPIDPRQLVEVAGGIVGGTVRGVFSVISNLTLVGVTLIFVLYELVVWPGKLEAAFDDPGPRQRFENVFEELQRYLGVKTVVSILTGLLIGTWVWALGVDFPLLWGLAAFLLNYVPVLGPFIAAVPAALVALVQHGSMRVIVLALGYVAVRLLINVLEPRLMGRRFGLSTTVVLISLVFWGWIWGALGMILSVPLTMTLKIALEHNDELSWVAGLLGRGPVRAPPAKA